MTILGQQLRSLSSSSGLLLQAQASLPSCNGTSIFLSSSSSSSSTISMSLSWMVYKDGVYDPSLTSTSRDKLKFKLNSYSLKPLSLYRVEVIVTNLLSENQASSKYSIDISVVQSMLVAQIQGGLSRYLRLGSSMLVDGSGSYDPDVPVGNLRVLSSNSLLSYEWDCSQTYPILSLNCDLNLFRNGSLLTISSSSSSSSIGSSYVITLKVSDFVSDDNVNDNMNTNNDRSSSVELLITISEPSSPLISISSKSTKINPSDQLVLYGSIESSIEVKSVWNKVEDDNLVDISSISLTNSSCWLLSSGTKSCNLVLMSNTLIGRSAPYIFSLSAIWSTSSSSSSISFSSISSKISININSPPLPGIFEVNPMTGYELNTTFVLSSSLWTDDDLPLSYEYRYLSSQGTELVIRGRSESSYASSLLPSGSVSSGYGLSCAVRVFDNLNANTQNNVVVVVKKMSLETNIESWKNKISNSLLANSGNIDATKQLLSLGISLLNSRNCSGLIVSCSSLNREECERSSTDNTCGECLSGYEGISGDSNTKCVSGKDYISSLSDLSSKICSSNIDCEPFGECDVSTSPSSCIRGNKRCVNDCSGHGSCIYYDFSQSTNTNTNNNNNNNNGDDGNNNNNNNNNNNEINKCLLGDESCEAICECESGWKGSSCSLTKTDMDLKISLRSELAQNLLDLSTIDEPSLDSVESWISSLSSLVCNVDELVKESTEIASSVTLNILELSSSLNLDSSLMLSVLKSLDVSTTVLLSSSNSNSLNSNSRIRSRSRYLQSTSSSSTILNALDLYGNATISSFVLGQNPVSSIGSSFRVMVDELSENNVKVSIPQSLWEESTGVYQSSMTILESSSSTSSSSNYHFKVSAFSIDSNLYEGVDNSKSDQYSSNPMRLLFSDGLIPNSVLISLPTLSEESYEVMWGLSNQTLNTTCVLGDFGRYEFECRGGINITHQCNGTWSTLITRCPLMERIPSCKVLNDGIFSGSGGSKFLNCTVSSFNSNQIECLCRAEDISSIEEIKLQQLQRHRLLSSESKILEASGVLEVSSVSLLVAKQFFGTMETAGDLNSASSLKKTLIVILMYSILWSVGLLGILGCSCLQRVNSHKLGGEEALMLKKEKAMLTRSNQDIKQYLMSYVNEVFPSVYQTTSSMDRLWTEIKKHHRYLLLFSTSGEIAESKRMMTGIQLLTVQSMLLFILAVCYDLQVSLNYFLIISI